MGEYWDCSNGHQNEMPMYQTPAQCNSCTAPYDGSGYCAEEDPWPGDTQSCEQDTNDNPPPPRPRHRRGSQPGCPENCPGPHEFTVTLSSDETACFRGLHDVVAQVDPPVESGGQYKFEILGDVPVEFEAGGKNVTSESATVRIKHSPPELEQTREKTTLKGSEVEIKLKFAFGGEEHEAEETIRVTFHDITFHVEQWSPHKASKVKFHMQDGPGAVEVWGPTENTRIFYCDAKAKLELHGCSHAAQCAANYKVGFTQAWGGGSNCTREWEYAIPSEYRDTSGNARPGTVKFWIRQPSQVLRDSVNNTMGSDGQPWYLMSAGETTAGKPATKPAAFSADDETLEFYMEDLPGTFDDNDMIQYSYEANQTAAMDAASDFSGMFLLKRVQFKDSFVARLSVQQQSPRRLLHLRGTDWSYDLESNFSKNSNDDLRPATREAPVRMADRWPPEGGLMPSNWGGPIPNQGRTTHTPTDL